MVLAVLLPTGMILAFQAIPEPPQEGDVVTAEKATKIYASFSGVQFEASCQERAGQLEVEIHILQPLQTPATNLYWLRENEKQPGALLGALRSTGTYRFLLPSGTDPEDVRELSVYDALQKTTIQSIALKP